MDNYYFETDNNFKRQFKKFLDKYVCPCCDYPTLGSRMHNEICGLCDWEDDGQDDDNADEVVSGPNADYSLTEARRNFQRHLTMYRPSDKERFVRFGKERIKEIKDIYDHLLMLRNEDEIRSQLTQASSLESGLRK